MLFCILIQMELKLLLLEVTFPRPHFIRKFIYYILSICIYAQMKLCFVTILSGYSYKTSLILRHNCPRESLVTVGNDILFIQS